jgi:hypothetical protein
MNSERIRQYFFSVFFKMQGRTRLTKLKPLVNNIWRSGKKFAIFQKKKFPKNVQVKHEKKWLKL